MSASVCVDAVVLDRASHAFYAEHGRYPTTLELADVTGLSAEEADRGVRFLVAAGLSARRGSGPGPGLRIIPGGQR